MFLAQSEGAVQISEGAAAGILIFYVVLLVLMVASLWKIFTKAGQPGWWSLIPIWNGIALIGIAGRPMWWFLLMMIPVVGLIIAIMVMLSLAERFGKGAGFALGLIFLGIIFFPILAFGDAEYEPV